MREFTRRHRQQLFADAVAAVEHRLTGPVAIDDVAREIATSRRQLQRVFVEVGQTTFREYVGARRMRRAAIMLVDGVSPSVVAYRLGYSSPSHFSRAFRRRSGVSPSAYARRRRAGPTPTSADRVVTRRLAPAR